MKTLLPEAKKLANWYLLDAENIPLGRLATRAALTLRGRYSPQYTPFLDRGDNIIIINAEKVKLTGKKYSQKSYFSHSQYPGGEKHRSLSKIGWQKVIRHAVYGMLPKNRLRNKMIIRLHVIEGSEHRFAAQKPEKLEL